MPTYVYECDTCQGTFEIEQRMADEPLTDCQCGKGNLKRVIQPVGVAFKGSGFYVNDSASSVPQAKSEPGCDGSGACPSCTPSEM